MSSQSFAKESSHLRRTVKGVNAKARDAKNPCDDKDNVAYCWLKKTSARISRLIFGDKGDFVSKDGKFVISYVEPDQRFEKKEWREWRKTKKILTLVEELMENRQAKVQEDGEFDGSTKIRRDAHAKTVACLSGVLTINEDNSALPKDAGIFLDAGETYRTWVRMSPPSGKVGADSGPLGMALKVFNVDGKRVTDVESPHPDTVDFLNISAPHFFLNSLKDYAYFQRLITKEQNVLWYFMPSLYKIVNLHWPMHGVQLMKAGKMRKSVTPNPLANDYFSVTPSMLGKDHAVKYIFKPCTKVAEMESSEEDSEFMSTNLYSQLKENRACFNMHVQFQKKGMKIENVTSEWSQEDSPPIPVAQLTIAKQDRDEKLIQECEASRFNPWNTLVEHQPLGRINRARRYVYQLSSYMRTKFNEEKLEGVSLDQ